MSLEKSFLICYFEIQIQITTYFSLKSNSQTIFFQIFTCSSIYYKLVMSFCQNVKFIRLVSVIRKSLLCNGIYQIHSPLFMFEIMALILPMNFFQYLEDSETKRFNEVSTFFSIQTLY